MEEQRKLAFSFAQDTTKQLITLSTGIIALTVTFWKDIAQPAGSLGRGLLMLSWLAFLASVICGVWAMLALTGTLEPTTDHDDGPSIRGKNVTVPSMAQILSFILGLVLAIAFAAASLWVSA